MNEIIKNTKQQFLAYRNGILADYLKNAGDPHKLIFGLNLPQIMSIAANIGKSKALANAFWNDANGSREGRLIAPMLMPANEMLQDEALAWCRGVETIEVADVLCHRLLRNLPYANDLALNLCESDDNMQRYVGLRLFANMLAMNNVADKSAVLDVARKLADIDTLKPVIRTIEDYCQ